ncbi:MAG: NAD(P)-dependent oxidoreductase, partial [Oscillospiraceae bacterium]|nr:NAD(P)-dependent oxidoreductase [Oscillospiraceae bacterium]
MKTVGFIGIGLMGRAMVRNLMKAGYDVTVYTRTKEKAQGNIDEGAHWAPTVAECVAGKDAVITMVGYPADVEEVYFGSGGVLENASPGALVIDSTTSTPDLAVRIAEAAVAKGLEPLDAPVTGGEKGAIAGTLTIMVGGERGAFDRAMPLFEAMGETIRYQGPAGNGQHCKMANQIGIASAISGLCEAVAYCDTVGLDPALVLDTIRGGSAGSAQMNLLYGKVLAKD